MNSKWERLAMIERLKALFSVLVCGPLFFCSIASGDVRQKYNLDTFDRLKLSASRHQAQQELGRPTKKVKLLENNKAIEEIWFYKQSIDVDGQSYEFDRIVLYFDEKDDRLNSKTFVPFENEAENSLEGVKSRYKLDGLRFEKAAFCSHYQLDTQYYHERSKGLTISERVGTREISSISWRLPELTLKQPASVIDRCRPVAHLSVEDMK